MARDAVATDMRRRIDGPYPAGTTRILRANDDGEVLALVPAAGGDGLQLRRYSSKGESVSTQRVGSGASTLFGDAIWLEDDSVVLAYRYQEPLSDAGLAPRLLPGVAKFDSAGRLVWNQTAFAAPAVDPTIVVISLALAGADADGNLVVRATALRQDAIGSEPTRLVRLDPDGNVVWARELSGARRLSSSTLSSDAKVSPDGSMAIVSMATANDYSTTYVDAVDAEGRLGRRVQLDLGLDGSATAFDAQGKLIAVQAGVVDLGVLTVERDASRCMIRRLPAPPCALDAQGAQKGCDDPAVSLTAAGDLFFGVAGTVGVAERP
jgi:hypothetical protein